MRRTALLFALFAWLAPPFAFADEPTEDTPPCQSSEESFWICAGDLAWGTGYLIPPSVLDLRQCQVWEECCGLVPNLEEERDTFQSQRDRALNDVELWKQDYAELVAHDEELEKLYTGCADELEERYELWEVVAIGGGTGVGALLLGFVIGGLAL